MKLVVGLGNTGARYQATRHNAGFMVVDELAHQYDATWKEESKLKAFIASIELNGETVVLAKPTTMMNLSGESVQRLMQKHKLAPNDVWVIFDDVDTPFGRLRIRQGGSGSGQQGVVSTIAAIGPSFWRVKFGISLNDRSIEPSEVYVLKPFKEDERVKLPGFLACAATIIVQAIVEPMPVAETFAFD